MGGGLNRFGYANQNPLSFIDTMGLSAADVAMALECVSELFPNLKVPSTFSFGDLKNPFTGNGAGGSTNAFTGALTFSRSMYGGKLANGDLGGLAITVTHEVMHSNQSFADRFTTKWQENFGNDSHNDEALQAVIRTRVDDCIKKKRDGKMCQ